MDLEKTGEDGSIKTRTLRIDADAALAGNVEWGIDGAELVVSKEFNGDPREIVEMMNKGLFDPGDEVSGDAWDLMKEKLEERAYGIVTRLLYTENEAYAKLIAEAFSNNVQWVCPKDKDVIIKVKGGKIDVEVEEAVQAGVVS